jgi:hypothetical protein
MPSVPKEPGVILLASRSLKTTFYPIVDVTAAVTDSAAKLCVGWAITCKAHVLYGLTAQADVCRHFFGI